MSEQETPSSAKPELRIGSYRLVRSLGAGGMSSVFKAVHVETRHEVALKVLPRTLAKNVTLLQRFLREAKNAEALQHPNIVSIFDRGVDQGRHYLVLEYVEGGDLHDRVKQQGPMGIAETVAVIKAVAEGLRYAAGQGLIHRDIKPANLLATPEGQVKIIDLGLALHSENEDERVTREGTTVGTVDFMAPEQARDSRATSERSDIYSLGCTFYFLLTGSPPYPGGNVADKLSRHCTHPAPDPKLLRSEISGPLSLLIQRMMAKRPEKRFQDYDELIAELDAVPAIDDVTLSEPLYAEFDEDDLPHSELTLNALIDDEEEPAAATDEPVFALLDEDDDDPLADPSTESLPRLDEPPARPGRKRKEDRRGDDPPSLAGFTLAELAALSDQGQSEPPKSRPSMPRKEKTPPPVEPPPALVLDEEELVEELAEGLAGKAMPRRSDVNAKNWVTTCALIGVGLLLLIVGIHQLIRATTAERAPLAEADSSSAPVAFKETPEPPPERPIVTREPVAAVARPSTPGTAMPSAPGRAESMAPQAVPKAWVEPVDPVPPSVAEAAYSAEVESKFVPSWALAEIPSRLPGSLVTVRRIVDRRDPAQQPSLARALEVIGGTVEIVDDGPFFEDDLRLHGDSRVVGARDGYRPIISVDSPVLDVVKEQQAVFVLDGKTLVLNGIDLVVNVQELPRNQTALFQCRGAALTLRHCTITVVNPRAQPFTVFRTAAAPRPSRIRCESTLVRGSVVTAFDLTSGSSEIVVSRSVMVGGMGPLIVAERFEPGADRRVSLTRSLLACRGPLIDLSLDSLQARGAPLVVRALGSWLARLSGTGLSGSLVASHGDGGIHDVLNWSGEDNRFLGWNDWLSGGSSRAVQVADISAARATWPSTDLLSKEDRTVVTAPDPLERVLPADLYAGLPASLPTLARVATPSAFLLEKTVESFPRPRVPVFRDAAPAVPKRSAPSPAPAPRVALPPVSNESKIVPAIKELTFAAGSGSEGADFGAFLREQIREGDTHLRVTLTGAGDLPCSPVRLPDGLSLEIVHPPTTDAAGAEINLVLPKGVAAEALFELHGGALILSDLRLTRDGSSAQRWLLLVDGGHLVLRHCRLSAPGTVEQGGGCLISFSARGSQPLAAEILPGPFEPAPDRPVCRLVDCVLNTGGDALTAAVGRGLVALTNCAIAAGQNAVVLNPAEVARSRFEADLWLDHCTITAERTFFLLGPWPGTQRGPDRPWLVTARDSALVAYFERGTRESVLLRVVPDSLARGSLFWQASNVAFDIPLFTALAGVAPVSPYSDVHRQWVEFWGLTHMRSITGPNRKGGTSTPSVRFHERLHPGGIVPTDLVLDKDHHPGRTKLDLGADLGWIPTKTARGARRR